VATGEHSWNPRWRSRNREYLIRRILWMLQAGAYGGLNEQRFRAALSPKAVISVSCLI